MSKSLWVAMESLTIIAYFPLIIAMHPCPDPSWPGLDFTLVALIKLRHRWLCPSWCNSWSLYYEMMDHCISMLHHILVTWIWLSQFQPTKPIFGQTISVDVRSVVRNDHIHRRKEICVIWPRWAANTPNIVVLLINSSFPGQNGRCVVRRPFQLHFLEWKWQNSDSNFTEICSQESIWQ